MGETSLVTLFSVTLALVLSKLALGFLNSFLKLKLILSLTDPWTAIFIASITIIISLLSGFYPSLIMSGYRPALALKNKIGNKNSSGYLLRRGLVVTQFFISQVLIIGTIILIAQMNYFRNKDLGFRKDAIIIVPIPVQEDPAATDSLKSSHMRTLRGEFLRLNGVTSASLNNSAPASGNVSGTGFTMEGKDSFYETQVKTIDSSYLNLFGLQLVAGKNIEDADTARNFLVNEKLARTVGYNNPSEIIGKTIRMWGKKLPVAGVVKDFHTMSLHTPIEPTILLNRIRNYRSMAIKISPAAMQQTIKKKKDNDIVQKKMGGILPGFHILIPIFRRIDPRVL